MGGDIFGWVMAGEHFYGGGWTYVLGDWGGWTFFMDGWVVGGMFCLGWGGMGKWFLYSPSENKHMFYYILILLNISVAW